MATKPTIGERNHRNLTISVRSGLDKTTETLGDLIEEARRLESGRTRDTGKLNLRIAELVKQHSKTISLVGKIWELITGAESETGTIEAQLSAITERLEAHEEVIRMVQELIRDRESAEQLFGESAK